MDRAGLRPFYFCSLGIGLTLFLTTLPFVCKHEMKATSFVIPQISRREYFLWLLRRRKRFKVAGASMFPLLKPGDEVLIDQRAYNHNRPESGDIVVAWHPGRSDLKIIKRVAAVFEDGTVSLQGENPFESTDFNRVSPGKIIGKVTCVFYSPSDKPTTNSS